MKKLLLLTLSLVTLNAYAQKDMAISLVSPANGETITGGQSFNLVVGVSNQGTTDISTADSVIIGIALNGTLMQNAAGQSLVFLYKPTNAIAVGQTINISVTGGIVAAINTSATNADFCVTGILRNGVVLDANTTNNTACTKVNALSGATGIGQSNLTFVEMIAYPNPAKDFMTIRHGLSNAKGSIAVRDLSGKLVATFPVSNEETSISLNEFAAGIYFYQVIDASNTILKTDKFIVSK